MTRSRMVAPGALDENWTCEDTLAREAFRLRRSAGRRTRHAFLAAQPHAHAEATPEHHRAAKRCCARRPRASRRWSPPRNMWVVTNVGAGRRRAARIARRSRCAHSGRARRAQHRRGDRPRRNSSGARAWRRADGRAAVGQLYRAMRRDIAGSSRRRSSWRARRAISWCWAFRPRGPRPATATSSAARHRGAAARRCRPTRSGASRKSRRCALARKYVASGKYFWNAGMFFWRVSTFLENLQRFLPATHAALARTAARQSARRGYASALRRIYPRLENISVDYAVMEPATRSRGQRRAFP